MSHWNNNYIVRREEWVCLLIMGGRGGSDKGGCNGDMCRINRISE